MPTSRAADVPWCPADNHVKLMAMEKTTSAQKWEEPSSGKRIVPIVVIGVAVTALVLGMNYHFKRDDHDTKLAQNQASESIVSQPLPTTGAPDTSGSAAVVDATPAPAAAPPEPAPAVKPRAETPARSPRAAPITIAPRAPAVPPAPDVGSRAPQPEPTVTPSPMPTPIPAPLPSGQTPQPLPDTSPQPSLPATSMPQPTPEPDRTN